MSETAPTPPAQVSGRHQRQLKNYLLDSKFQLKYTGYLVGTGLVIGLILGLILWYVSDAVLVQANQGVQLSQQAVARGQEALQETKKVNAVVTMNIVKDPDYKDNPALREAFEGDAQKQEQRLGTQQANLERQAQALQVQSLSLAQQRKWLALALGGGLLLLVVMMGVAGIYVTHKISGPIFKMRQYLGAVAIGHLKVPRPLRPGDELVDFFESFSHMVRELRRRQEKEIATLDEAIAQLEGKAEPGALQPLHALREKMQNALKV